MKKLFAIIIAIALIFVLCSCQTADDEISTGSSYSSEPTANSQIENTVSEIEEPETSSQTESTDDTTDVVVSNSTEEVLSNPTNNNTSNDTSSKENVAEQKPKEPIDFVPNKIPAFNSETGKADYENATIPYRNNVWYKGVRYAATSGKSNGTNCSAIVTVGDNDEYLDCVYVLDSKNNEQAYFNIYNDRIYYFKYMLNDARDYILLNDFAICSVNLSGNDKKEEKKLDLSFTHVLSGEPIRYLNSKYLFFEVSNLFDGIYDDVYRYNIETCELVKLDFKIGAHKTPYSIGERVFIWNYDNGEIYEYDVDLKNEKHFHTVDDPHRINSLVVSLQENGFLLHHWERDDKYLLDFSGNRTQIS